MYFITMDKLNEITNQIINTLEENDVQYGSIDKVFENVKKRISG